MSWTKASACILLLCSFSILLVSNFSFVSKALESIINWDELDREMGSKSHLKKMESDVVLN
jgi:hypothetical protein